MDIFCQTLDLPTRVKDGLAMNLELMANKDNRTLAEAFPIMFDELLNQPPFELSLIHGKEDKAINCNNSIRIIIIRNKVL